VRVASAPAGPATGFAVGVQWHPEYDWPTDAVSRAIFAQFGEVVRAYSERTRFGGVSVAAD
jgi:putative glutamine amidotransferase